MGKEHGGRWSNIAEVWDFGKIQAHPHFIVLYRCHTFYSEGWTVPAAKRLLLPSLQGLGPNPQYLWGLPLCNATGWVELKLEMYLPLTFLLKHCFSNENSYQIHLWEIDEKRLISQRLKQKADYSYVVYHASETLAHCNQRWGRCTFSKGHNTVFSSLLVLCRL